MRNSKARAANDDFAPVLDVAVDQLLETERLGPAMIDGQRVDREAGFQRRVLVEIVDDDLGDGVALDLDDHARVLIRLVAHGGDVGDDLLVHQLGDALHQHRAVHVVRNFRDDDLLAAAFELLDADLAAHLHAAAPGLEILLDALQPADHAAGREIRPFDELHQLLERDVRVVDLRADAVDDLAQIMRRHVGGHADGDAGAAVDQQVGKRGGKDRRLGAGLVVIGDEIHRVLVHVLHQRGAEVRQARLGVTHGRRRIAFDGAEVPLAVHQPFAHRPRLRHVDQRRINHRLAVRMVIAAGVAADLGALAVLAVRKQREVVHRVQDAALRRLEPVAHVRQRARNDHRHRVIEERVLDLVGDVDLGDFFAGGEQRRVAHRQIIRIVFFVSHKYFSIEIRN